jgi:hypothetical protein
MQRNTLAFQAAAARTVDSTVVAACQSTVQTADAVAATALDVR